MKKSVVWAAVLGWFAATTAGANQRGYICELSNLGEGFVKSPVVVLLDPQKNKVIVNDPIIHYVYNAPLAGELKTRSDGTYRLRWRVNNIPTITDSTNASYTAILDPESNTISITGRVAGGSNQLRGSGRCTDLADSEIRRFIQQ